MCRLFSENIILAVVSLNFLVLATIASIFHFSFSFTSETLIARVSFRVYTSYSNSFLTFKMCDYVSQLLIYQLRFPLAPKNSSIWFGICLIFTWWLCYCFSQQINHVQTLFPSVFCDSVSLKFSRFPVYE